MHILNKHLGTINKGVEFIGISVEDNAALFQFSGSLDAILEGGDETTVVVWTQLSGTPVNYTTPTTGTHIEFTTTDLSLKSFRCCVNVGTDFEQCAIANFFHYPKEEISIGDIILSHSRNTWFPSASSMIIHADPGAYKNINNNDSVLEIKPGIISENTEFTLTGIKDFDVEAFESIKWQKQVGGVWTDIDDSFYANNSKLYHSGVGNGNSVRALVTINHYGIYKELVITDSKVLTELQKKSGMVEVVMIDNVIHSTVVNLKEHLSSLTTRNENESIIVGKVLLNDIHNFTEQHGSLGNMNTVDSINIGNAAVFSHIENIIETLHSSTGII